MLQQSSPVMDWAVRPQGNPNKGREGTVGEHGKGKSEASVAVTRSDQPVSHRLRRGRRDRRLTRIDRGPPGAGTRLFRLRSKAEASAALVCSLKVHGSCLHLVSVQQIFIGLRSALLSH